MKYISMQELVTIAWGMRDDYVTGGPAWLNSEHYDIVAKARDATPVSELRLMLQSLLMERFRLQVHMEKKPMPVYAMVVGKKVKLQESTAPANEKPSCKVQGVQERTDGQILRSFICKKMTMALLAERLPNVAPAYFDRPVVDLTELKGDYDFALAWTPRGRNAPAPVKNSDAPTVSGTGWRHRVRRSPKPARPETGAAQTPDGYSGCRQGGAHTHRKLIVRQQIPSRTFRAVVALPKSERAPHGDP
jgi:uncharacterized protein (TIGR03435 family)